MKNFFFRSLVVGAAFALTLGAAQTAVATTYQNVSGIVVETGGPGPGPLPPGPTLNINDAPTNDPSDIILEIVDDFSLYGGVRHSNTNQYADAFTFDFGTGVYNGVFNWTNINGPADFSLIQNGPNGTNVIALSGSGSRTGTNFTGVFTFIVDPRQGQGSAVEDVRYNFQFTQVMAPVPLPAGAVLLLGGLGGLAALRRKRKAA